MQQWRGHDDVSGENNKTSFTVHLHENGVCVSQKRKNTKTGFRGKDLTMPLSSSPCGREIFWKRMCILSLQWIAMWTGKHLYSRTCFSSSQTTPPTTGPACTLQHFWCFVRSRAHRDHFQNIAVWTWNRLKMATKIINRMLLWRQTTCGMIEMGESETNWRFGREGAKQRRIDPVIMIIIIEDVKQIHSTGSNHDPEERLREDVR